MKHKIYCDEAKDMLVVKYVGEILTDDIYEMIDRIDETFKDKDYRYILTDVTEGKISNTKLKKKNERPLKRLKIWYNTTDVGADTGVRMILWLVTTLLGKSKSTRCFSTQDEAFGWLKGDVKSETRTLL